MSYFNIAEHYERCFTKHGDSHQGVDWPNSEDVITRHNVMLELIKDNTQPTTLLDFGCGTGHLLDTIRLQNLDALNYAGVDISAKLIECCQLKFPETSFQCIDILVENLPTRYDYIVCNGVFTEKLTLSYEEMFGFLGRVLVTLWKNCNKGLAFNVMSKHVDWEREDLFHVPMDELAQFCKTNLSRHFIMRADYGLYEYTTYVYRDPSHSIAKHRHLQS